MNELASWLLSLRQAAKISLPALSEKTKIISRHLEALEQGKPEALPTRVHARAFALAYARACGADDDEAMEKVAAAFNTADKGPAAPAPAEAPMRKGMRSKPSAKAAEPAPEQAPPLESEQEPPADRKLPWKQWLIVAVSAVAFLFLLHALVTAIRGGKAAAPALTDTGNQAVLPAAAGGSESLSPTAVSDELALRARRPCWVLLVIDGKRLPVVFLEQDKRERWLVKDKAVMLAGNVGAVRIWWRGDNLGYFGELGDRLNGVVFENGKPWRRDPSQDLALPAGVPSKPVK